MCMRSWPETAPEEELEWIEARLSDEESGFSMRGWRGHPREVFRVADAPTRRLRIDCMREHPERHRLAPAGAAESIRETLELAQAWDPGFEPPVGPSVELGMYLLGAHWEADFVLLAERTPGAGHVFQGGCVCFPSGWAPEDKLGRNLWDVHRPVPGLNAAVGSRVEALLARLPAGDAWLRMNWGLAADARLNRHPLLELPRPSVDLDIGGLCWRVEHQALVRLPRTAGILFGIRVLCFPLSRVRERRKLAARLAGQVRSMPGELRHYKAIDGVADCVADWLES